MGYLIHHSPTQSVTVDTETARGQDHSTQTTPIESAQIAEMLTPTKDMPPEVQLERSEDTTASTAQPAHILSTILVTATMLRDSIISPQRRAQFLEALQAFVATHPYLSAFIVLDIFFSGPAIVLFTAIVVSTACFAIFWGLLLGMLGAAIAIAGVVALSLCVLVPVLFATAGAAVSIWVAGMVSWWIFGLLTSQGNGQPDKAIGVSPEQKAISREKQISDKPSASGTIVQEEVWKSEFNAAAHGTSTGS